MALPLNVYANNLSACRCELASPNRGGSLNLTNISVLYNCAIRKQPEHFAVCRAVVQSSDTRRNYSSTNTRGALFGDLYSPKQSRRV